MKYTDSQIEEAARILCEMRGVDPDADFVVYADYRSSYSYAHHAKEEIRRHLMLPQDIESALRQAVERQPNAN